MGFLDNLFDSGRDIFDNGREKLERSMKAREYISQAKSYIRDGEEIYENAYGKVRTYAFDTQYEISKHNDYKKSIAMEIGGDIATAIYRADNFILEGPAICKHSDINLNVFDACSKLFEDTIVDEIVTVFELKKRYSLLDLFISDEDYYEARRRKDDAKYFKTQMKMERERLYNCKEKMREIRYFMDEEKREIDSLMVKIRKMKNDLNYRVDKGNLTKDEENDLKALNDITKLIVKLLETNFLSDSFEINGKYSEIFQNIKSINGELPDAPDVKNIGKPSIRVLLDRM